MNTHSVFLGVAGNVGVIMLSNATPSGNEANPLPGSCGRSVWAEFEAVRVRYRVGRRTLPDARATPGAAARDRRAEGWVHTIEDKACFLIYLPEIQ